MTLCYLQDSLDRYFISSMKKVMMKQHFFRVVYVKVCMYLYLHYYEVRESLLGLRCQHLPREWQIVKKHIVVSEQKQNSVSKTKK